VGDFDMIRPMSASWVSALKRDFAAGVLTLLPIVVTVWLFRVLFNLFDGLASPYLDRAVGRHIPGLGIAFSLLLVLSVGAVSSNVAGKKLFAIVEKILENIPLVKSIYASAKQLVGAIAGPGRRSLTRVVFVEYPRRGIYSLGFVTSHAPWKRQAGLPENAVSVLIPAALNPTSGVMVIVPADELIDPGFSVEEGIKLTVSGGFVAPGG
jgi:uncharacterized membrane protein